MGKYAKYWYTLIGVVITLAAAYALRAMRWT